MEQTIRAVRLRPVRVPLKRALPTRVGSFTEWTFLLIDLETDPCHRLRSDVNGNGSADGEDIRPFMTALLGV